VFRRWKVKACNRKWIYVAAVAVSVACVVIVLTTMRSEEPVTDSQLGFTKEEVQTLTSLEKIDDHPLYVMYYAGSYRDLALPAVASASDAAYLPPFACTVFAAMADPEQRLVGRNFDWPHHPALLLFTNPPGAYASVTMVDLSFLFDDETAEALDELPLQDLRGLLYTPYWTFDGMNERGLVVGMAAVSETAVAVDPSLPDVDSLPIMRDILDYAATVEEALTLITSVNIDFFGGPCMHYLIADAAGNSAIVEFWEDETYILRSEESWQFMTNYRLCLFPEDERAGMCWRYDGVLASLTDAQGAATLQGALSTLDAVHYEPPGKPEYGTQWSIVYGMMTGEILLALEHDYETIHRFELPLAHAE